MNRPRDIEGRVIEPDSIPEFTSIGGRALLGGGGVFPDLEVLSDTLSSGERELLNATVEAEFPLQTRIQETAFTAVRAIRESADSEAEFPPELFDNLFQSILESGISEDLLTDEARDYLMWRTEAIYYQRLDREDRALEIQSDRDTVLQTAVRLLRASDDQATLFALARAEQEERAQAEAETVDAGSNR